MWEPLPPSLTWVWRRLVGWVCLRVSIFSLTITHPIANYNFTHHPYIQPLDLTYIYPSIHTPSHSTLHPSIHPVTQPYIHPSIHTPSRSTLHTFIHLYIDTSIHPMEETKHPPTNSVQVIIYDIGPRFYKHYTVFLCPPRSALRIVLN